MIELTHFKTQEVSSDTASANMQIFIQDVQRKGGKVYRCVGDLNGRVFACIVQVEKDQLKAARFDLDAYLKKMALEQAGELLAKEKQAAHPPAKEKKKKAGA